MEERTLIAEKTRVRRALVYDFLWFAIGAILLLVSWLKPTLPLGWIVFALGCLLMLYGLFLMHNTILIFSTRVIISDRYILIESRPVGLFLNWSKIKQVIIRERQKGIEPGRADRLIFFMGPTMAIVNSNIFSVEDETFLLDTIGIQQERHSFRVDIVNDR